jgi:prepilin signal peptidase PulO-like enzyme (type II secretory pathway)
MSLIFSIVLIPIAIADLQQRVIPNIYLKLLTCLMVISFLINGCPPVKVILSCLVMALALCALKVGMGDVKLLSLLVLTFQCQVIPCLALISAAAMVHIVISTGRYRAIPETIPFAPAILCGFITYCATR